MTIKINVSNNVVQHIIGDLRKVETIEVHFPEGDVPTIGAPKGTTAYALYDGDSPNIIPSINLVDGPDASTWGSSLTYRKVRRILSVWIGCEDTKIVFRKADDTFLPDSDLDNSVSFSVFRPRPSFVALWMRPTAFRSLLSKGLDQAWVFGPPPYLPSAVLSSIGKATGSFGLEFGSLRQSDLNKCERKKIQECPRVYAHMIEPSLSTDRSYLQQVTEADENWQYAANCSHSYPLEASANTPGYQQMEGKIGARHVDGYQNNSSRSIGYELWYMTRHDQPSRTTCSVLVPKTNDDVVNSYIYGAGNRLFELLLSMVGYSTKAIVDARAHVTSKTVRKYMKVYCKKDGDWGFLFDRIFAINGAENRSIQPLIHELSSMEDASKFTQADVFAVSNTAGTYTSCNNQKNPWTSSSWNLAQRVQASMYPWVTALSATAQPIGVKRRGKKIYSISRGGSRGSLAVCKQGAFQNIGSTSPITVTLPAFPISIESRLVMTCGILLKLHSSSMPEARAFASSGNLGTDTLGPWATGDTTTASLPSISKRTFINRRVITPAEYDKERPNLDLLEKISFSWE